MTQGVQDTDPRIARMMIAGYRAMSPAQKLETVVQMNNAVLEMAAARLRQQYGKMTNRELKLRLAALWIDREMLKRAFGYDPDTHGY